MLLIRTRNLELAIVEHHDAEGPKRDAGRYLYLIHVVDFEVAGLFDPILNEWVTQGMFGFGFRKIRSRDDETVFAHFASQLNGSRQLNHGRAGRVGVNYHRLSAGHVGQGAP
jgi:hypothetical protein